MEVSNNVTLIFLASFSLNCSLSHSSCFILDCKLSLLLCFFFFTIIIFSHAEKLKQKIFVALAKTSGIHDSPLAVIL